MEATRGERTPLENAPHHIPHARSKLDEKIDNLRETIQKHTDELSDLTKRRGESTSQAKFKERTIRRIEREDDKQGCHRALKRFSNIFQKPGLTKEVKSHSSTVRRLQIEIKDKQRVISTLNEKLQKLEQIQSVTAAITHHLNISNDPSAELKQLMNSTTREIFADAVQQVFKNRLSMSKKQAFRKFLCAEFPAIKEFILFREKFEVRTILPQGSRFIIDMLQKSGANEKEAAINHPCFVFDRPESLVEHIQQAANGEPNSPQILLVRCKIPKKPHNPHHKVEDRSNELSFHTTPLLFEKTEDGNIVLVWTDSAANFGFLEREMVEITEALEKMGLKLNLFFLEQLRQHSRYNCATFSINDAIGFSKHHDELISLCRRSIDGQSDSNLYHLPLENLPQRFVWFIQNSKAAEQYRETLRPEEQEVFDKKYEKYREETIEGHKQNIRDERIGDKYEGIIWQNVINETPPNNGLFPYVKSFLGL